jgi:uncharacterized membrane protein
MHKVLALCALAISFWAVEARAQTFNTIAYPDPTIGDTIAGGISNNGLIVGSYGVACPCAAFLNNSGSFSNTNYPNASYTEAWGINNSGVIVGFYSGPSGDRFHGYTNIDGNFTSFDYPGAVNRVSPGATYPFAINDDYVDVNGHTHGFTNTNGTLMSFVSGHRASRTGAASTRKARRAGAQDRQEAQLLLRSNGALVLKKK